MDDEIVEKEDQYYKIGAKAVLSAILYSTITAITMLVIPLTSTGIFSYFQIDFNLLNQGFILVIGVLLTILSFFYNLFYKAKPLASGILGILRYGLILLDTVILFLLFYNIQVDLTWIPSITVTVVVSAMFLLPYWYGTLLLVVVVFQLLRSILQAIFWKELRIKKKSQHKK